MLKAVIFDFDGVVADSEPLHFRAFNDVLAEFGAQISRQDYYAKYLGFTDADCAEAVNADFGLELDDGQIEELLEKKKVVFERLVRSENSIIDGVEQFLTMLKENNVRIAICSGALLSDIELMLAGSGLEGYFEFKVTADDVEKGKPDPAGFLLALERLNATEENPIAASECVVVEDSHWGLEAASAAGMHSLAVTNTYTADELQLAEAIVESLGQVTMEQLLGLCD